MKKKLIALVAAFALVMSLAIVAGCTQPQTTVDPNANPNNATGVAVLDSLPSNLPNGDHIPRMALQAETGSECYTCHGASETGNPTDPTARIVPEDHYVDQSYDSGAFDPVRSTCNSCHGGPVPGT